MPAGRAHLSELCRVSSLSRQALLDWGHVLLRQDLRKAPPGIPTGHHGPGFDGVPGPTGRAVPWGTVLLEYLPACLLTCWVLGPQGHLLCSWPLCPLEHALLPWL